jgi:hypothetical protein
MKGNQSDLIRAKLEIKKFFPRRGKIIVGIMIPHDISILVEDE